MILSYIFSMKNHRLIEEKVSAYISGHHMLCPGDRVAVGVSGGADSVCLLFLLLSLRRKMDLSLAAVHVNHCLRKEAGEDARYVEKLCAEQGVAFFLVERDVEKEAKALKCSVEEAGRKVRYEAFGQAAESFRADKIAVAHNSNDRSETMLFHLFRGSGIRGLGSIRPVRGNIIRPLLCLERREIEAYLADRGIDYCRDASNDKDCYTRNRIRRNVLPYVEKEIAPGCIPRMAQTAELLSEAEDYLEEQTLAAAEGCAACSGRGVADLRYEVSVEGLLQCHPFMQKRVLFHLVKSLSPRAKDISRVHIESLCGLFAGEGGSRMACLPFGIVGRREYGRVILEREEAAAQGFAGMPAGQMANPITTGSRTSIPINGMPINGMPINGQGERILVWGNFRAEYAVLDNSAEKNQEIPQNEYTKWFDCDKIIKSPEIRSRRTGDYLTLADHEGKLIHQSLKDFLINRKVPAGERDGIPLLADGSHILWVVGYRISEHYKVSAHTKHILQVRVDNVRTKGMETEDEDGRAYQGTFDGTGSRPQNPGDRGHDQPGLRR